MWYDLPRSAAWTSTRRAATRPLARRSGGGGEVLVYRRTAAQTATVAAAGPRRRRRGVGTALEEHGRVQDGAAKSRPATLAQRAPVAMVDDVLSPSSATRVVVASPSARGVARRRAPGGTVRHVGAVNTAGGCRSPSSPPRPMAGRKPPLLRGKTTSSSRWRRSSRLARSACEVRAGQGLLAARAP